MYLDPTEKIKGTVVDENMKKYNEDDINYSIMLRLETGFGQNGELCDDTDALVFRETIKSV